MLVSALVEPLITRTEKGDNKKAPSRETGLDVEALIMADQLPHISHPSGLSNEQVI